MTDLPIDTCLFGEALEVLRTLPSDSVHCCVTSPPYWGLRDYGRAKQLGLEATPDLYVKRVARIFAQVRRVLRPDGTLFLNLGDSYAGSWGAQSRSGELADRSIAEARSIADRTIAARQIARAGRRSAGTGSPKRTPSCKPKDLIGVPWMVAFALRSEIIWHKPNPTPESIGDRPTKAHEQVFLFAKSRRYFYDAAAIAEPLEHPADATASDASRSFSRKRAVAPTARQDAVELDKDTPTTRNARDVWSIPSEPYSGAHFATMPTALAKRCILAGCPEGGVVLDPFMGSGTVAKVAQDTGRRWVGVELNPEYEPLIRERTKQTGLVFGAEARDA